MAADDGHVFEHSGPTHLPAIDWTYEPHRRSIAASLVQACYILEYDRKNQRPEALAPPWWMFFHFQLISEIKDKDESTIFGAIFQYNPPSEGCKHFKQRDTPAPKYLIAFHGTILSGSRNITLGLKTIINDLRHQGSQRSAIALKIVKDFVAAHESANIWIAGHSLGSSIGMYVGRHMAKDHDVLLKTYLFNPLFISPPLKWINEVKHLKYVAKSLKRAGIDKVAKGPDKTRRKTDESFDRLSAWVPSLFVHSADPVCSRYISHFEKREMLKTTCGSYYQRISMKASTLALFSSVVYSTVGMDLNDPEPLHLLPSASVTINRSHSHSLPRSHELDQWWKGDLDVNKECVFPCERSQQVIADDEAHVFERSGPTHLPAIDWTYEPHRRSIAASLVQACYILEYDRKNQRPEALAPPWWVFFHFQLISQILDKDEITIFGAIFQYNPPSEGCKHFKAHNTPKYVIAFRGTIRGFRDIKLNVRTIANRLQGSKRTAIALKKVHDFIAKHGSANIWIAGHSLGSSIGMYVGKHMAKTYDVLLETYLFNPPFISPPLDWIKSEEVQNLKSLTRAAIDKVAKGLDKNRKKTDESFDRLSAWVPSLFVNAADPVCSGYISYFEKREKSNMKVSGLALFFNVVYSTVGMALNDPEPLHLLPSASVTINRSHSHSLTRSHELDQWWNSLRDSHKLDQWWKADLAWQPTIYHLCNSESQVPHSESEFGNNTN